MTGVEIPDYSGVLTFAGIVLAVGIFVFLFFKGLLPALSALWRDSALPAEDLAARDTENRIKRMMYGCPTKPVYSHRPANWRRRPHLKKDTQLCGYIAPEKWECNCGKAKCETFGNLCKVVGATDATPPVQPLPDRKAAIAHTKGKS